MASAHTRSSGGGQMADVKALLQERVEDLVRELAPEGRRNGGYWIACNPGRIDKRPGSFFVFLGHGGKTPGAWLDKASDQKGDIIDLVCLAKGCDRAGALAWAKQWLNYEKIDPTEFERRRAEAVARARARDAEEQRVSADNQARAAKLFKRSKIARFAGSPADRYLSSRGIGSAELGRQPGILGWLERCRHVETDTFWPALVAGMTDTAGRVQAVHRTFLQPDGSGKAELGRDERGDPYKPRKIWPGFKGLFIPLWCGETEVSWRAAEKHGLVDTLALCEGVEDGLSIALARPDLRVWAAGSLGNLAEIHLPVCCERVIVAADNDWGKPQAERALERAIAALQGQGRRVSIARSPVGKDFNDCILLGASAARSAAAPDHQEGV